MSVSAIINPPYVPLLEFCGSFTCPITSKSFVLTMINAIEGRNYHALQEKSHKKLLLTLVEQDHHGSLDGIAGDLSKEVIKVYYDKMFMGYTDLEQLYIAFKAIKQELDSVETD